MPIPIPSVTWKVTPVAARMTLTVTLLTSVTQTQAPASQSVMTTHRVRVGTRSVTWVMKTVLSAAGTVDPQLDAVQVIILHF